MSGSHSARPAASRPGTGCLEALSTPFPETSWQIAWLHSLFGNAPAKVARLATESGLFPVFEAEAGQMVSSTPIRH